MRGISAVIAVVLILMITVALASMAYVWFTAVFKTTAGAGGAEAERITETGKALMKIETISEDKIYLRNIGDTNLSGFAVYLNDVPVNYTSDKEVLAKGEVAEIKITDCIPTINEIKITTAQGIQEIKKFKELLFCDTSLVLYLKFDEGFDTTAKDSSYYGNDGILINGPVWVPGKSGKALEFDCYDDYVNCGNDTSLNIIDDITVEAWINETGSELSCPRSGVIQNIARKEGAWLFDLKACTKLIVEINTNRNRMSAEILDSIPTGWVHIAFTFLEESPEIYVNGVQVKTTDTSVTGMTTIDSTTEHVKIGHITEFLSFYGTIDEVKIYNRVLSPEEIKAHYESLK